MRCIPTISQKSIPVERIVVDNGSVVKNGYSWSYSRETGNCPLESPNSQTSEANPLRASKPKREPEYD